MKLVTYPLFPACLLVSLSIPIIEKSFPERFSSVQESRMLSTLLDSPELTEPQKEAINEALQSGSASEVGRALYPQYYRAGYGAPGYEQGPLSARDYPRLVFFLTGENSSDLALPVEERVGSFPNGSAALAILCPADYPNFPEVLAAGFFNPAGGLERVFSRSAAADAMPAHQSPLLKMEACASRQGGRAAQPAPAKASTTAARQTRVAVIGSHGARFSRLARAEFVFMGFSPAGPSCWYAAIHAIRGETARRF